MTMFVVATVVTTVDNGDFKNRTSMQFFKSFAEAKEMMEFEASSYLEDRNEDVDECDFTLIPKCSISGCQKLDREKFSKIVSAVFEISDGVWIGFPEEHFVF